MIFTGRVTGQHCEWRVIGGERSIVTLVNFEVSALHKGRAGGPVTLQFLGGTMGDTTLEVSEIPKFVPGDRVVLFVANNGASVSPLVGFHHGKFRVERDAAGTDRIVAPHGPLGDVTEIGKAAILRKPGQPLSHDEFAAKIREAAAKGN